MKTFLFACTALPCLLALGSPARGQALPPSATVAAAVRVAQQHYIASFASHPELFNGPEYLDYAKPYHARTGHQFFSSAENQPGSVRYNNHDFDNITLNYDVVLDQVVLSPPHSPLTLRLINEKVAGFVIGGHHFSRLIADSSSRSVIRTGYYEVLLDSTVQVLAKRSKYKQEHINQRFIDVEFSSADKLFIQKAHRYYSVASKASVLHLFADRNKELQKYLQERKLRFNKASREASIVQLATYYCSLPPR